MTLRPLVIPTDIALQYGSKHPFLRLPHPRTLAPSMYLYVDSSTSTLGGRLYELQSVSDSGDDCRRSWFVQDTRGDRIESDGRLMMMTPFDPLFLLLSLLISQPNEPPLQSDCELGYFQSIDDLLERCLATWTRSECTDVEQKDREHFISLHLIKSTVPRLCDNKLDEEPLWRLSRNKVLKQLDVKIHKISSSFDISGSDVMARAAAKEQLVVGSDLATDLIEEIKHNLALDLVAQYLPATVTEYYRSLHPLPLLTAHRVRAAAHSDLALSSASYMPGRSSASLFDEDGQASSKLGKAAATANKKGSRGVEALKKVNTKGMKKLGDMFAAQTGQAKRKIDKDDGEQRDGEVRRSPRKKSRVP